MHLYALDEKENLISAHQANKQMNYFCRECHSIVRCRGGFLRQIHFYHLEPNRACRQSGKSLVHLQIQYYLQRVLSECELEKRFPSINRIADVAWEEEKLVFEIQCSPITACEIEARNRDYQSLGFQVIWILHDRLYNKSRLTAAEYFLQETPHYFTDMNSEGHGRIYDQWDVIKKGKRLKTLGLREVKISAHQVCNEELFSKKEYPKWVLKRIQSWPIYFSGDYLDYLMMSEDSEQTDFLSGVASQEREILNEVQPKLGWWGKLRKLLSFLTFPYRLTVYLVVDRLAR